MRIIKCAIMQALLPLALVLPLAGCGTDRRDPGTVRTEEETRALAPAIETTAAPETEPAESRRTPAAEAFVLTDGSEDHPYEAIGLTADAGQNVSEEDGALALWASPKENPLRLGGLPSDMGGYLWLDLDLYIGTRLKENAILRVVCGDGSYFWKSVALTGSGWKNVSFRLSDGFREGDPSFDNAECIELSLENVSGNVKDFYLRSAVLRPDETARADDPDRFEAIADRFAYVRFGGEKTEYNEKAIRRIDRDCMSVRASIRRTDKGDPFGSGLSYSSSTMSNLYSRIYNMAIAYGAPASEYYHDPSLRDDIVYCLDYMYDTYYGRPVGGKVGGNWHDSFVNSPASLTTILLALREDLTPEQITHYLDYLDVIDQVPTYSSANMIDIAYSVFVSCVLQKQEARLNTARKILEREVFRVVKNSDGVYSDGSFLFHTNTPYTTGYGGSLLDLLSIEMYALHGSDFAFSDDEVAMQVGWIYNVFQPVLFRGAAMSATSGRIIHSDASENTRAVCVITGMARIAEYAPEADRARIRSLLKYYLAANTYDFKSVVSLSTLDFLTSLETDDAVVAAEPEVSAKVYPKMARVTVHNGPFAAMLSMYSPTVANYEAFLPGFNTNGWYTGAGMLYVYADSTSQYDQNYHHYANHYRLPGTTVDTRARSEANNTPSFNKSAFVGGAALDSWAAAAIAYDDNNTDFRSDLKAKKSYFFFDDEYVMLGAGITSTRDNGVITTVENHKLTGKADGLFLNGADEAVSATKDTVAENVAYANIPSFGGMVFPEKQTLTVHTVTRVAKFAEIFFDHGKNPKDDTYSYILLPLADAEKTAAYAAAPDAEILVNTPALQAVREGKLRLTSAVFWNAGTLEDVTTDFACVMMRKEEEGALRFSVCDPTMKLKAGKTLVLDGVYTLSDAPDCVTAASADGRTTVTVDFTGAEGASICFTLTR